MIKVFLALVALVVLGESHMCLLNPYQRGGPIPMASLNTAASKECALTMDPCGGVNASSADEITGFGAGEPIVVFMQKNLDHYNAAAPGKFVLELIGGANHKKTLFGSIADTASPSLSVIEVKGVIPHNAAGNYALQGVYYTNNPDAPAAFYQCADIVVRGPPQTTAGDEEERPVHTRTKIDILGL